MKLSTTEKTSIIQDLRKTIERCSDLLVKLSSTCCIPARSETMDSLLNDFSKFEHDTNSFTGNMQNIESAINRVNDFGSVIGKLHVSCCTATREKLYQEILSSLNNIYCDLWRMKGVNH